MLLTLLVQMQAKLAERARGQGFVEYALIIVLVAVALAASLTLFKDGLSDMIAIVIPCFAGSC